MKRFFLAAAAFAALLLSSAAGYGADFETFNVWPDLAPGESADTEKPTFEYWKPASKTSDACLVVCPGGGYNGLAYEHEGDKIARYFTGKGITTVVLRYRTPRREGLPKHMAAWQDEQRTVRLVRSHAEEWGINPDKIGIMGFSAGGHLVLMASTTSLTNSYDPVDDVDKLSCSVNFAVPVYPAYVLQGSPNLGGHGYEDDDTPMVDDFAFDAATPPMCLVHGDADYICPMGSVAIYGQLRKMNIPAELHIYAGINHGFGAKPTDNHVGDWLNRVYAWMGKMGF